jgi:hypothetical protein
MRLAKLVGWLFGLRCGLVDRSRQYCLHEKGGFHADFLSNARLFEKGEAYR